MFKWYLNLNLFEQFFYPIAMLSSVLLMLKGMLNLLGMPFAEQREKIRPDENAPDDTSTDASFPFFSFVGITSFLAVGSWGTLFAYSLEYTPVLSLLIGAVAGGIEMLATIQIIRIFDKHQDKFSIEDTIGMTGLVSQTIPPQNLGEGLVNIVMHKRITEFPAISLEKHSLPANTRVTVAGTQKEKLIVQKYVE